MCGVEPEQLTYLPRMVDEASESCFCSEILDIILGIDSGALQHMHSCNI